jgi:hypothetical protein
MTANEGTDHPIISRPWEYQIVQFSYYKPYDESETYIDLGLRKGNGLRILRFLRREAFEFLKASQTRPVSRSSM